MNQFDEPWTADDVPRGPYFHGTRHRIEIGDALKVGTINPKGGDNRCVTWATTDYERALYWARKRNTSADSTLYVYEVELDDPEVDVNVHHGTREAITSVMAASGRVVRLVSASPAPGAFP